MPATLEQPATALPTLSNEEIARYSRHLILPEVGMEGQQKLKAAKVLCVGTGGLGAPLALYLTAAGVGTIGLVDFDVVDESNLQRQIIHSQSTVGKLKVDSAEIMLKGLNKNVNVVKHNTMLTSANALEIFKDYDVIADGTDNFQTRYLVNDACVLTGKPNAYGSIFRFEGQASVFATEDGPCYRCLYPEPPPPGLVPSCAEGGVLGILPGLVGVIQATEVIKLILGIGEPLDRPPAARRRARHELPHPQAAQEPRVPRLRHPRDQGADRLRPVLRHRSARRQAGPLAKSHGMTDANANLVDGIPQITVEELKHASTRQRALHPRCPRAARVPIVNLGVPQIPVGQLPTASARSPSAKNAEIVTHCKSGGRSQKAALSLKAAGFTNVKTSPAASPPGPSASTPRCRSINPYPCRPPQGSANTAAARP